jgi:acyl-CoA reductase-like NAD-dependent aldehyde dehydrogenase
VPEMGLEETKEAISAASTAFKSWGKTTAKERHDVLVRFHKLMQDNAEDLARIIVRLVKPRLHSTYELNVVKNRHWRMARHWPKPRYA